MSLVTSSIDSLGVATVTLNRPDKHNALDGETVRQLTATLVELDGNAAVRVVVLTGAGASFCAGADIAHMRAMLTASEAENVADALSVANCMRTLDELSRPVIARVNGNVYGGGVGLVACADIAVAADTVKLALTEVRLGIVPAVISPYVVAAIGPRAARRLFLSAAPFDAQEARTLGLIHFLTASASLDQVVNEQVDSLLRAGPEAARAAKKLVRRVATFADREVLARETAQLLAKLRTSPEGQEGLSAFLERRQAHWVPKLD
jgi:methylglutaconyl-CoA hydratase